MLDALTHKQRYYMFNAVKPQYKSHAGKQMDPNFSWKQKTSPMVFSPEAGLGQWQHLLGMRKSDTLSALALGSRTACWLVQSFSAGACSCSAWPMQRGRGDVLTLHRPPVCPLPILSPGSDV